MIIVDYLCNNLLPFRLRLWTAMSMSLVSASVSGVQPLSGQYLSEMHQQLHFILKQIIQSSSLQQIRNDIRKVCENQVPSLPFRHYKHLHICILILFHLNQLPYRKFINLSKIILEWPGWWQKSSLGSPAALWISFLRGWINDKNYYSEQNGSFKVSVWVSGRPLKQHLRRYFPPKLAHPS